MNIAIAGYGIEGESNYKYWSQDNNNHLTIFDEVQPDREVPADANIVIGEDAFEKMDGFDLVIRTAGLAPRKIKSDGKIWSATNEFFAKCPAKIIGVTGSKGKGTTASLIANVLEKTGRKVWLVGNIGLPALDVLAKISAKDIVVYELSSFQLWDLEKSPHIAVVLFIEQEHLDVHVDMEDYVRAKANIAKYQNSDDLLIYNKFNKYSKSIADQSAAIKIGYIDEKTAHVKNSTIYYNEQKICPTKCLKLVGAHNYDNVCAAIDVVWGFTTDVNIIKLGIVLFSGLPHRLQFIREVDGVGYYDDSIATTPSSAIAALRSFDNSKVIILGGSSKGSDFNELAKELSNHDVSALLIGVEAQKIASACRLNGFNNFEIVEYSNMDDLVRKARTLSKPGGVVLMSPASASFGLFKNYSDRGEQFTKAIEKL